MLAWLDGCFLGHACGVAINVLKGHQDSRKDSPQLRRIRPSKTSGLAFGDPRHAEAALPA